MLDVLRRQGFEKLTMQRVAKEANIATGTLYNYFKDKDELLVYAAERLFAKIRELMQKAVEENADPHVKLLEMIRSVFIFFNENISFFQFLDSAQIYSKMTISVKKDHIVQVNELLREVLRHGIKEKIFREVPVEITADLIHRAIVGTICIKPEIEVFDPETEAKSLAEIFNTFLQ